MKPDGAAARIDTDAVSCELFAESTRQGWLLVYLNALTALVIGIVQLTSGDDLIRSYATFVSRCGASTLASFILLRLVILQEGPRNAWPQWGWSAVIGQEILILATTGIAAFFYLSADSYVLNAQLLVLLGAIGVLSAVLTPRHGVAVVAGRAALFAPVALFFLIHRPPLWGLLFGLAIISYIFTVFVAGWVYRQSVRTALASVRLSELTVRLQEGSDRLASALEAEQRSRRQIERESNLRDRFVHAVTHDLRQTLSGLKLHNHVFASQQAGEATDRFSRIVSDTLASADATIGSVAQAAWLATEDTAPQLGGIDLEGFLPRIVEEVGPMLKQAGIELRFVPSGLTISADAAFLDRIIRNLLYNALHHSTGQKVLLGVRRGSGSCRISVLDTGPGIEPELQERIFDLYVQGPETAQRAVGNVGLGLSIVKDLAQRMGAQAGLRSVAGAGSTFYVEVPVVDALEGHLASPCAGEAGVIVIVDDDALSLSALVAGVRGCGWRAVGLGRYDADIDSEAHGYILDYYLDGGRTARDLLSKLGYVDPSAVLIVSTGLAPADETSLRRDGFAVCAKPVPTQVLQSFLNGLPIRARQGVSRPA